MIVDARQLEQRFSLECDLCIVGGGAAGIALAVALAGSKLAIVLLEGGGFERSEDVQDLYRGVYSGNVPTLSDSYLSDGRLRYFGGTTNHWGGYCRPLEAIDFERRDWVDHSGWPFGRDELIPWYRKASDFLGIGSFDRDDPDADDKRLPDAFSDADFQGRVFRFRGVRFARAYGEPIASSRDVRLVHHANAVDIDVGEAGRAVERVEVATLGGVRGSVRARRYVLAAGALENARLLLSSDRRTPGGVGNRHDLVGRFFMEHAVTHVGLGPMVVWPEVSVDLYQPRDKTRHHRAQFLYARDATLRRERMLTISMFAARATDEQRAERSDLDRAVAITGAEADAGVAPPARNGDPQLLQMVCMCEPQPNPDSRVTLTDDRDALGLRRLNLAWNLTGLELDTIARFADLLGRRIAARGLGRVKLPSSTDSLLEVLSYGFHHMGTTRMHDDPSQGVVDANARVHGVENLYVAGSSVFPTAGAANPTFTIIALALRLADQLATA